MQLKKFKSALFGNPGHFFKFYKNFNHLLNFNQTCNYSSDMNHLCESFFSANLRNSRRLSAKSVNSSMSLSLFSENSVILQSFYLDQICERNTI